MPFDECPDCGYQAGDEMVAQAEREELKALRSRVAELEAAIQDALGRYQVTHIHSALRQVVKP